MSEFEVLGMQESGFVSPVAVIGFPTVGLVGSILASYISKAMEMEYVAGIASHDLPPYALIHGGEPYPPIRLYGHRPEEGRHLVVVTSEVTPRPEMSRGIALAVLDVLERFGVSEIISIEGVGRCDQPDDPSDPGIVACGSGGAALSRAREAGIGILSDGLVHGATGVMLYECADRGIDMLALLCPANPGMPDPRASAALIASLSKLIPGLEVDLEPLLNEAAEMESRVQDTDRDECGDTFRQLYG
jgi:uncharacterized protein